MARLLILGAGLLAALAAVPPVLAETVVTQRMIRAQTIIMPEDVTLSDKSMPGMLASLDAVIGQETRVAIYPGRPIRPSDVGPPAIIDRNQTVVLVFQSPTLSISTEGRALGRGGVGDRIKVMNVASRTTVIGTIAPDASVRVTTGG